MDTELLILKEKVERDPSLMSTLTQEQKDKLIEFYTEMIKYKKIKNKQLNDELNKIKR